MSRAKGAENKRKPARVAAGPEMSGIARGVGETVGRVLRPFIPLLIILVVTASLSALLWRSMASAAGLDGSPGASDSAQFVESTAADRLSGRVIVNALLQQRRPPWISPEDFKQTALLGLFAQNRSIFEPNLSRSLARVYEGSPWVERVRVLKLRYPAQMEIEIDWRMPVAREERNNLVFDRNGVALNLLADGTVAKLMNLPAISGVLFTRTEAGKMLPSEAERDVCKAALGLLSVAQEALTRSPGQLKVVNIQREPAGTWRVDTDRGPLIYWGFFTDEKDRPIDEPRTEEKVDLLRRRLCESKDPTRMEYVKVYTAQAPVKLRR